MVGSFLFLFFCFILEFKLTSLNFYLLQHTLNSLWSVSLESKIKQREVETLPDVLFLLIDIFFRYKARQYKI